MPSVSPKVRDLRLDLFRGLALIFIFIDHIPDNLLGYFTLASVSFCDAAEAFIFISGYSAALVYGGAMERRGALYGTAQIMRRVWQLYVAHLVLFVVYTAVVSYTLGTIENPLFAEELRVGAFLEEPHVAIVMVMLLLFQPVFLDILPLYIVLLLLFPLILIVMRVHVAAILVPSLLLYLAVQVTDIAPVAYPRDRTWFFNPYAWQFLFVLGALFGTAQVNRRSLFPLSPWLAAAAGAFALFAAAIQISWSLHRFFPEVPGLLLAVLYPIDKADLAPLRLISFLAIAYLTVYSVPRDARFLGWSWLAPVILMGQHSLHVFCLGILLSLLGHLAMTEVSSSFAMQVALTAVGILIMIGLARILDWYKRAARETPERPAAVPAGSSLGQTPGRAS